MKAALAIAIGLLGVAALAFAAHPAKSANNCAKSCTVSSHMLMPGMPMGGAVVADNPQPRGEPKGQAADEAMQAMNDTHIIAGHMSMTKSRPASAADRARADAILTALRGAVEPFKDYRAAEQAGYKQFLPNIPQPVYHFTNWSNAFQNVFSFDPARPTSLMYRKTAGGYELIGAMYTAAEKATDEQLNARVPLSIATRICARRRPIARLRCSNPTPSSVWPAPSQPPTRVRKRAERSSRSSTIGWCMCGRSKKIRRKYGPRKKILARWVIWGTCERSCCRLGKRTNAAWTRTNSLLNASSPNSTATSSD